MKSILTHRLTAVLGGLALAVGGLLVTAPAAHADSDSCVSYLERFGQAEEDIRPACDTGARGDYFECLGFLEDIVEPRVAVQACRLAGRSF
ncbi:hypothetical protein ACFYOI_14710 [Streptomyces microflavus]|uniref:hypothetical protein n=1 Tax=Streptomyces microflavus TaxID=1919 RepID=UPI0033AC4767